MDGKIEVGGIKGGVGLDSNSILKILIKSQSNKIQSTAYKKVAHD